MKHMKSILYVITCLIGLSAIAQDRQIEFKQRDWKAQLALAKQENKLIFFDAYTSWCGPCKVMAKNVFTRNEVADLFNTEFINAKYDMEKGEGITLKDRYDVTAYPTYLFINGEGEVVHKIVGSMTTNAFMIEAKKALNPENTMYGLAKNFEASNRSEASAMAYLDALDKAYEVDKRSVVSKLYFDALPQSELLKEQHYTLAIKYLNNPSSKAFSYLYTNKEKLRGKLSVKTVNNYFQQVFGASVYSIKKAYAKNKGIEEAIENTQAIRKLLTEDLNYAKVLLTKLDLIEFAAANQWSKYAKKVGKICQDHYFSDKSYVIIEAANDLVTANQSKYFKDVFKWAGSIEKHGAELFTRIQLAELRKRTLTRQGKTIEAETMALKEKELRQEAADKRQMTPPIMKN